MTGKLLILLLVISIQLPGQNSYSSIFTDSEINDFLHRTEYPRTGDLPKLKPRIISWSGFEDELKPPDSLAKDQSELLGISISPAMAINSIFPDTIIYQKIFSPEDYTWFHQQIEALQGGKWRKQTQRIVNRHFKANAIGRRSPGYDPDIYYSLPLFTKNGKYALRKEHHASGGSYIRVLQKTERASWHDIGGFIGMIE